MAEFNWGHTVIPQLIDTLTALVMGAMVRVHSLQSAPEHNGVLGEIVNHNAVKGRWFVKTATGRVISLKLLNLTIVKRSTAAAE